MKKTSQLLARAARSEIAVGILIGVLVSAAGFAISKAMPVAVTGAPISSPENRISSGVPDFGMENVSDDARHMANWVASSKDAGGVPFVIVDKKEAKIYVFDRSARLLGASAVLIGGAKGDDSIPGIGTRPLDKIAATEKTTPAGRFVAERGRDERNEDVVWVDYDAAVSIHRVLTTNPAEKRLERLASPTSSDNRISYGCINVPVKFYETYLPAIAQQRGIIYVLPELKTLKQVFALSY